jgi:hypothetical protein
LAGAWKTVDDAEILDLSGEIAGGEERVYREKGKARSWRRSGVEVLDLTGD